MGVLWNIIVIDVVGFLIAFNIIKIHYDFEIEYVPEHTIQYRSAICFMITNKYYRDVSDTGFWWLHFYKIIYRQTRAHAHAHIL